MEESVHNFALVLFVLIKQKSRLKAKKIQPLAVVEKIFAARTCANVTRKASYVERNVNA